MKKIFKALKFPIVFTVFLSSFIACDKDFSVIESSVLGEENSSFAVKDTSYSVIAYNKKLEALQINNLNSNVLGVFNDPEYGTTTASIVTQVIPTTFTEDFGVNPVIDSIVINIPYFNTSVSVDNDGNTVYKLDSVYGNPNAKFKLSIYQNNYFLLDFDPSSETNSSQNYYSKTEDLMDPTHNFTLNGTQTIDFDNHLGQLIYENDEFTPSSDAIITKTGEGEDEVETRSEPAFRVSFNDIVNDANEIAFWQETIVARSGQPELSDANSFKNYFRGLYFKAEAIGTDGNMLLLNLGTSDANITITYTKGEATARVQDEYVLNFTATNQNSVLRLNTFINDFSSVILEDGDKDNGDETLYIKGLEGSMAVVDLFGTEDLDGNMLPDKLDAFLKEYRETNDDGEFITDESGNYVLKRLINEAHLAIYEDSLKVFNELDDNGNKYHKFDRIYAYDIKNNAPTIDYLIDPTESNEPLSSKFFSLGQRNDSGKFKIRITEHLNNIIQNDSTNYKLGLVLSNNVNYTANSEILNSTDDITAIPSASIISPRGTILHGNNVDVINEDKKLSLDIFYTKPK